jgi:hypothetical protein
MAPTISLALDKDCDGGGGDNDDDRGKKQGFLLETTDGEGFHLCSSQCQVTQDPNRYSPHQPLWKSAERKRPFNTGILNSTSLRTNVIHIHFSHIRKFL